jgi:hypothetical protein
LRGYVRRVDLFKEHAAAAFLKLREARDQQQGGRGKSKTPTLLDDLDDEAPF